MPFTYPASLRRLINELSKLPSIGEKSAIRLAYHLLTHNKEDSLQLSVAIQEAIETTKLCKICYFLTESKICSLCSDEHRDPSLLCVVEKPADVFALEKSGGYRGLYHVLHGVWSPLRGVGPESTKIAELLSRLRRCDDATPAESADDPIQHPVRELILATGTTVEGDATALYIANCVEELEIPVTRIAQGIPKGGELEYADEMTLNLSLEGRRKL